MVTEKKEIKPTVEDVQKQLQQSKEEIANLKKQKAQFEYNEIVLRRQINRLSDQLLEHEGNDKLNSLKADYPELFENAKSSDN